MHNIKSNLKKTWKWRKKENLCREGRVTEKIVTSDWSVVAVCLCLALERDSSFINRIKKWNVSQRLCVWSESQRYYSSETSGAGWPDSIKHFSPDNSLIGTRYSISYRKIFVFISRKQLAPYKLIFHNFKLPSDPRFPMLLITNWPNQNWRQ